MNLRRRVAGLFVLTAAMAALAGCSGGDQNEASDAGNSSRTAPITNASTASPAGSASGSTASSGSGAAKVASAILVCPVTGEKIASIDAAVGHSTYKGKTYYFCCGSCKPKFDQAPQKYAENAAKGKFESM